MPRTPGSRCGRRRSAGSISIPTNGVIPTDSHITVAYGRDYDDVSPVSGVLLGGRDQRMTVAVDVTPVG